MRAITEIREDIASCDKELARLLARRMDCIGEIIDYKKLNGMPILQPEQEARQSCGKVFWMEIFMKRSNWKYLSVFYK